MSNGDLMNNSTKSWDFWIEYLMKADMVLDTPLYEIFHFDDNEPDANELVVLVIEGKKLGTASLLWEYQTGNKQQPKAGDLSVVTDWDGFPQCVIETTLVDVIPFKNVDEKFASSEGEGDLSLKYWKDVHWEYFGRVCEELNRERSLEMMVVCENFEVVYPTG
jgi:uncharacterized protein YhfF